MNIAVAEFLDDLRGGRMEEAPVVKVEQGQLQGRIVAGQGKTYYSFQGIPYAKPPLGSLRFKDPIPAEPWEGIRDASSEGNESAQIDWLKGAYSGDENSLFLNVYTPNLDGSFLPVMVFVHGGGLRFGSGNTSTYGPDYLVEKDVVVVTFNYRLGALGFLCLNTPDVPGNAGLKDQALALKWVKDNIENFGGNPGNVTVFGQSAGGVCTSILTASPLTKHSVSKAIVQSGCALAPWAWQHTPLDNARALAKQLGCESNDPEDILNYLQSTSTRELVEATEALDPLKNMGETGKNMFTLVIEKEFPNVNSMVSESFLDYLTSGRVADVPIMTGYTEVEMPKEPTIDDLTHLIPADLNIDRNSLEAVEIAEKIKQVYFKGEKLSVETWPEYFKLNSDVFFGLNHHRYVKNLIAVSNKPVYYYNFAYKGSLNVSRMVLKNLMAVGYNYAAHSDELGYLFRNELNEGVEPTHQDLKTRERLVSLWTNFAKTGNPTPEENHTINVIWQPVTSETEYYLRIGDELSLETNLDSAKMDFWDELYNKHFKIWEQPRSNGNDVPVMMKFDEVETQQVVEQVVEKTIVVEESQIEEEKPVVEETIVVETQVEEEIPVEEPVIESPVEEPKEEEKIPEPEKVTEEKLPEVKSVQKEGQNGHIQNGDARKTRPSNEIKMVQPNGIAKDVIRANDPPEDDLPKNIGVNKFVNFFESLGGKK